MCGLWYCLDAPSDCYCCNTCLRACAHIQMPPFTDSCVLCILFSAYYAQVIPSALNVGFVSFSLRCRFVSPQFINSTTEISQPTSHTVTLPYQQHIHTLMAVVGGVIVCCCLPGYYHTHTTLPLSIRRRPPRFNRRPPYPTISHPLPSFSAKIDVSARVMKL
jgi:hypothetical protein